MKDFLTASERAQLESLRQADALVDRALRQVGRILNSQKFARVQQKAQDFLGFIVSKRLLDRADEIKEVTIAVWAYGEPSDFNPAEDAKIRVAGGDLRRRLAEYYADEGRHDSIEIAMPLDTYVPEIRDRRATIGVGRFENWHLYGDQDFLCGSISDELTYLLNQLEWVQARRVERLEPEASAWKYYLRGSFETHDDCVRLNISLASASTGAAVYWTSVDGRRDALMVLTKKVVEGILPPLENNVRLHPTVVGSASRQQPQFA